MRHDMEDFYGRNMTMEFGMELLHLNKIVAQQERAIDELELKAAKYKAHFYGRTDLAAKLQNQIVENHDYLVGEFDGFCYCSKRARAEYRTIADMHRHGLITGEEYRFCEV